MDDIRLRKILNFLVICKSVDYQRDLLVRKNSEDIFYIGNERSINIIGNQDHYSVELNLKDKTIVLHGWNESHHNGDWYGHTEVSYPFSKLSDDWLERTFKEKFAHHLKIEEEKRLAEARKIAEDILLNKKIEDFFKE